MGSGRSVAVITGASSGIGQATAREFADSGFNVVLAARQAEALEALSQEMANLGVEALAVPTDVSDEAQVEALARATVERFGRIDVWVNNAAVGIFGRFHEIPMEDFRRTIETNMWGYVYGARAALRQFKEQGRGKLINVSSLAGKTGTPWAVPYAMSNSAILTMSQSLREELVGTKGISVSAVIPASIDTPFFEHAADFTGRQVQAMPPVYPAEDVAHEIMKLVHKPKPEVYVGQTPWHLRFFHAHAKPLFERFFHRQVWRTHFAHNATVPTEGILFEPRGVHAEVSGGWPHQVGGTKGKAIFAGVLGVLAGATWLVWHRRSTAL